MPQVNCVKLLPDKSDKVFDNNLRIILEYGYGSPLEHYIYSILRKVCKEVGKPENELNDIIVEVQLVDKPKTGWAFKHVEKHRDKFEGMANIIIGFAYDYEDFTETLIHESLHLLDYDEEVTEAKALKIASKIKEVSDDRQD